MSDDQMRYLNFYGDQIKLTHCRSEIFEEYVIDSPPFPFERWLSCTICMATVLLHIGLQHSHSMVLSLVCFVLFILTIFKLQTKVKKGIS